MCGPTTSSSSRPTLSNEHRHLPGQTKERARRSSTLEPPDHTHPPMNALIPTHLSKAEVATGNSDDDSGPSCASNEDSDTQSEGKTTCSSSPLDSPSSHPPQQPPHPPSPSTTTTPLPLTLTLTLASSNPPPNTPGPSDSNPVDHLTTSLAALRFLPPSVRRNAKRTPRETQYGSKQIT